MEEEVYRCNICNEKFSEKDDLSAHVLKHFDVKPNNKNECGTSGDLSNTEDGLKTGMVSHTTENPQPFAESSGKKQETGTNTLTQSENKFHLCAACCSMFTSQENLDKHMLTHSDENPPHRCSVCDEPFEKTESLIAHMLVHNDAERHHCYICGSVFDTEAVLKSHMPTHSAQNDPYSCIVCNERFGEAEGLKKHMECHTYEEVAGHAHCCIVCGVLYSTEDQLTKHLLTHVGKLPPCIVCGNTYSTEDELFDHLLTHTSEGTSQPDKISDGEVGSENGEVGSENLMTHILDSLDKPIFCHFCGHQLNPKDDIQAHLAKHTNEKRDVYCNNCGHLFQTQDHLVRHCGKCGKQIEYTTALKRDILVDKLKFQHPFKCDICGKGFAAKGNFHRHMFTHATCPIPKPNECKICGMGFMKFVSLKKHLLFHEQKGHKLTEHLVKQDDHDKAKDIKSLSCEICSKQFQRNSNLQRQMLTHTGEKPHRCDVCGKRFCEKSEMRAHLLIHTGDQVQDMTRQDQKQRTNRPCVVSMCPVPISSAPKKTRKTKDEAK